MKYSIEVTNIEEDADYPFFGVEIRPPLGELAAKGLCKALTQRPIPEETNNEQFVTDAYVTRNDTEGTALFIAWNQPKKYDTENTIIGLKIQSIIDPCSRHEVTIPEEGDLM
jgi:hypothetical protein